MQESFWLTEATIQRIFSAKQVNPVARYCVTMTKSSTKPGILSKMHFFTSSAGGVLLHGMLKEVLLFLPLFKLDAYLYGQI